MPVLCDREWSQEVYESLFNENDSDSIAHLSLLIEICLGSKYYDSPKVDYYRNHPKYAVLLDYEDVSKEGKSIFEKAEKDIKSKKLIAEVDEDGFLIKFGDFLEWAFAKNIPFSEEFLHVLGLHRKQTDKLFRKRIVLQAAAQAIWYYDHLIPIDELEEHEEIVSLLGERRYSKNTKNSLREFFKHIDPRPKKYRIKRSKNSPSLEKPFPPKSIPDLQSKNGLKDFFTTKIACKVLFYTIKRLNPEESLNSLIKHPLIVLTLQGTHNITESIAVKWFEQVENTIFAKWFDLVEEKQTSIRWFEF